MDTRAKCDNSADPHVALDAFDRFWLVTRAFAAVSALASLAIIEEALPTPRPRESLMATAMNIQESTVSGGQSFL